MIFAFAMMGCVLTTPLVTHFAGWVGAIDKPDQFRRIHKGAIPRLGGLGLATQRSQPLARLLLDVDHPVEVLLRALEPIEGLELMMANRPASRLADIARGPGRLATALGITRELDGLDLCAGGGPLWLADAVRKRGRIGVGPRIGISLETHRPLRFFELGNPSVSGPRSTRQRALARGAEAS